ncbi:MAG: GNAT family N-acetyltransferase [Gemmatimonadota bacterium]
MEVRFAEAGEVDQLAKLWYDAWQDGHAEILPAELKRRRTLESFRDRLQAGLPSIRVVGPPGGPVGLCMVKDDELYQLFVAAEARGTGVAAALVADAEARLAENGVEIAWLSCAIGNDRAARFYEKCGWRRVGTMLSHLETPEGEFPLESWRYEKILTSPG